MKKFFSSLLVVTLSISLLVSCNPPSAAPSPTAVSTSPAAPPTQKSVTQAPATTSTPAPKPQTTPATKAPAAQPYYQGKTIQLIAATAPGGGTDATARVVATFLGRYIPGNPKIIVTNQPGAGGVVAANSFYAKAKPDGFTLLHGSDSLMGSQQKNMDIVQYDLNKMALIGNIGTPGPVFGIRKDAMARLKDPNGPPAIVGTKDGQETWEVVPLFGKEFLGWNVRWLPGFGGTGDIVLAVRRGEVDMFGDSQNIKTLADEGIMEVIATVGNYANGKFNRRPDFPNVPTLEEYLGDKKPTGVAWDGMLAAVAPNAVFKFTAAPAGTPGDVAALLRDAYGKLKQDQQVIDMLKKTFADEFEIKSGQDTQNLMKQAVSASPEAVAYLAGLLKKFGVTK